MDLKWRQRIDIDFAVATIYYVGIHSEHPHQSHLVSIQLLECFFQRLRFTQLLFRRLIDDHASVRGWRIHVSALILLFLRGPVCDLGQDIFERDDGASQHPNQINYQGTSPKRLMTFIQLRIHIRGNFNPTTDKTDNCEPRET